MSSASALRETVDDYVGEKQLPALTRRATSVDQRISNLTRSTSGMSRFHATENNIRGSERSASGSLKEGVGKGRTPSYDGIATLPARLEKQPKNKIRPSKGDAKIPEGSINLNSHVIRPSSAGIEVEGKSLDSEKMGDIIRNLEREFEYVEGARIASLMQDTAESTDEKRLNFGCSQNQGLTSNIETILDYTQKLEFQKGNDEVEGKEISTGFRFYKHLVRQTVSVSASGQIQNDALSDHHSLLEASVEMKDEKAFGIKRRGSLFRKASKSGSPRRTHTHHAPRHSSAITSPHVKQEMVPEVKKHPHLSATSKSVECFQTKSEKASEDTNEQVSIAPLNIIGTSKEKILSEAALMDQNSSPRLRRRSGDIFSLSPRSSGSRPHSRLFDRTTVDEVAALVEDVVPDTNSIREALEDYAANMGMSVDVSSIFKSKNDVLNGSKFRFCAEIAQLRASRTTATSADELISIYSSNNYSQTSILAQSSQMGSTEYDPQTALPSHLISRQRRSSCDSTGFRSVSSADRPPGSFEGKVRETDLEPTQLLSILDMAEVIKSPSNASPIQTPLTRSRRSSLDVPMARASKAGRPPSRLYEITMHIDDPPIVDESRDSRIETTKPLRCNDNPPNQDLALFTKSTELSKPQEVVQRQAPNVRDSRYRQSAELSLSEHLPSGKLIEGIFPINMDQDTGTPLSILGASISLRKHLHSRQSPDASRRSIASVSSIRPSKLAYSIAVDSSTVNDSGDVQNDPQKAFTPSKYPEYETLHNFSSFAIRAEQSNPLLEGLVTWASIHDEGDSVEEQTQLPFLRPNFSLFRHEDVATSPLPVEDQNIATRSEVAGQTHRPASASENMQVDVKEETSLRKRPNSDGDNVKCRCTLL